MATVIIHIASLLYHRSLRPISRHNNPAAPVTKMYIGLASTDLLHHYLHTVLCYLYYIG